jgi:ABC-2 type transport system permease protein
VRGNFEHSGRLIRLILRRERVMSAIWIACLLLFSVGLAPGLEGMFETEARMALAETLKNPGMIAMMGPVYGADNYHTGAMYSNMMMIWIIITVAVMNIFLVVRHTRADEEKGRGEVVRSLPVGRLANLNATMIVAVIVNAVHGLLTGLGIAALGVEGMDLGGSMLYGAVLGVSGLFFAAVAALFSQLCSTSRGASGYSMLALGVFFMMRAAGDINSEALSLASPIGLIQRAQAYVENHWPPVLIVLLEAAVVTVAAFALNAVRDMGQGFIPARPGRREASRLLRSPLGLSFRLLRNTLIAWTVSMFALGVAYGAILGDIDAFINESPFYQQVIGTAEGYTNLEMFTATIFAIMSMFCLIPVVTAALKVRAEEKEDRAEHVLARVVPRWRYLSGYVVQAFIAGVLCQAATAAGLYAAAAAVLEEPMRMGFLMEASLVYLPALWIIMGLTVLLVGLLPRAASAIWAFFAFCFFASFMGRMMPLPEWLPKLSPFGYIPQLPVDSVNYGTLAVLTAIAAVLTAVGFVCYGRRDTKA